MSDFKFKIGDVVQLVSGSVPMTVTRLYRDNIGRDMVETMWYDEATNSIKSQKEISQNALKTN